MQESFCESRMFSYIPTKKQFSGVHLQDFIENLQVGENFAISTDGDGF